MSLADEIPSYTCRCLNVRIIVRQHNGSQPEPVLEVDYKPVYVGEDGIVVLHNELTFRRRTAVSVEPVPSQWTELSCFICKTLAYRIRQDVNAFTEAKRGHVSPSDEWVEHETLRTKTGWVDVHVGDKGCIKGGAISQLTSGSNYSNFFNVVLPPTEFTPTPAKELKVPDFPPLDLPSLFPPAPFTPSHPVFLHLLGSATAISNHHRQSVQSSIDKFVQDQLQVLESTENELRKQVELLWQCFKLALSSIDAEQTNQNQRNRSASNAKPSTSVIREFNPTFAGPKSIATAIPGPPSALSASLATSTLHAAFSNKAPHSQSPPRQPFLGNNRTATIAKAPIPAEVDDDGIDVPRNTRRNMNETHDTATSFKLYQVEEAEANAANARQRRLEAQAQKTPKAAVTEQTEVSKKEDAQPGTSDIPVRNGEPNGINSRREPTQSRSKERTARSTSGSRRNSKRKVTFSVDPDVKVIPVNSTGPTVSEGADEMLFNIDEDFRTQPAVENKEEVSYEKEMVTEKVTTPTDPTQEQPRSSRRVRDMSLAGLPQSFSSLRPSSLPAPSSVRPPIKVAPVEEPTQASSSVRSPSPKKHSSPKASSGHKSQGESSEREIRQLVAADMPSHRGAWDVDGDNWRIFKRIGKSRSAMAVIDESDRSPEQGVIHEVAPSRSVNIGWERFVPDTIAQSLPVEIHPELSSNTNSMSSRTPKNKTPAELRKQAHVERDRNRGEDPGVLAFVNDGDDDFDDVPQEAGGRGKEYALRILKARNELPPAGMWRSLAT